MLNIPFHLENQCLKTHQLLTNINQPLFKNQPSLIIFRTYQQKFGQQKGDWWILLSFEKLLPEPRKKRQLLRWILHPSLVRGWIVHFIWTYCQIGLIDFSKIGAKNPKTLNLSHGLNKTRFKQHQCLHPFWVFAFGVIVSRCVNSFQNKSAKMVWFIHKKVQVPTKNTLLPMIMEVEKFAYFPHKTHLGDIPCSTEP